MCHVHDEMKTVLVWVLGVGCWMLGVGVQGRRVSFRPTSSAVTSEMRRLLTFADVCRGLTDEISSFLAGELHLGDVCVGDPAPL